MAEWRTANPSNKPCTCLWCGLKLRYGTHVIDPRAAKYETAKNAKAGGYEDDFFCGLRCAYLFAVKLANDGHRLHLKDPRQ